jgi:hypothetical protein
MKKENDDDTSFVPDLVGIDQMTGDQSISEGQFSDVADASATISPITHAVSKAAFLVTNWLVGEGER